MDFTNKVAEIAELEGHHPVMHVGYGECTIELWTHAINGLSENDFILAAKIDEVLG
jgi:4a-hydroxytetrahydrobiopterin dehydratase